MIFNLFFLIIRSLKSRGGEHNVWDPASLFIQFGITLLLVLLLLSILVSLIHFVVMNLCNSSDLVGPLFYYTYFQLCLCTVICVGLYYANATLAYVHLDFGTVPLYFFHFRLLFGVDGISALFLWLIPFFQFLLLYYVNTHEISDLRRTLSLLLPLSAILYLFFLALDLFLLFLFLELSLIPLFLFVGSLGSNKERITASYKLYFYTLCGSFLLFFVLIYIYNTQGTLALPQLYAPEHSFTYSEQLYLWGLTFLALAFKIPLIPLHLWLPAAHVEAPTIGSVLLAAIILKMATFTFWRLLLPLFPSAAISFFPVICALCFISMTLAAFTANRLTDIKKIVAYSSIVHMSFITIGSLLPDPAALTASLIGSIGHAIISGGLFISVGILYERFHSREISNLAGSLNLISQLKAPMFIFFLANMAIPFTINFFPEIFLLNAIKTYSPLLAVLLCIPLLLNSGYNIVLLTLLNGPVKNTSSDNTAKAPSDLTLGEHIIVLTLAVLIISLGLLAFLLPSICHGSYQLLVAVADAHLVPPAS
jgi:NADH-quinone oxidoreductase subunit M